MPSLSSLYIFGSSLTIQADSESVPNPTHLFEPRGICSALLQALATQYRCNKVHLCKARAPPSFVTIFQNKFNSYAGDFTLQNCYWFPKNKYKAQKSFLSISRNALCHWIRALQSQKHPLTCKWSFYNAIMRRGKGKSIHLEAFLPSITSSPGQRPSFVNLASASLGILWGLWATFNLFLKWYPNLRENRRLGGNYSFKENATSTCFSSKDSTFPRVLPAYFRWNHEAWQPLIAQF